MDLTWGRSMGWGRSLGGCKSLGVGGNRSFSYIWVISVRIHLCTGMGQEPGRVQEPGCGREQELFLYLGNLCTHSPLHLQRLLQFCPLVTHLQTEHIFTPPLLLLSEYVGIGHHYLREHHKIFGLIKDTLKSSL